MTAEAARHALQVRELRQADLEAVVRIDALRTGERKPEYWGGVFGDFLGAETGARRVGLSAEEEGALVGYLLGEIRAFEFGSEACGWVFAVAVDPEHSRRSVGSALLGEARRRFRAAGVSRLRTMVRRNDVPVLAFFRSSGFVGGSFVQLEQDLEEGS
jgi:ribosomal protein S18 acetylase RimI-like enzyme